MFEHFIENNFTMVQLEYIIRIVLACFCGLFIGFERSKRQKEAGLRTHIILAMGCAILTIVSKYGFNDVLVDSGLGVEASRIASNIVTGIGFLGAGVIFVRGGSVRGLTTAAGIWATAGIGLAIGSGLYIIGIVSTILLMVVQVVIHKLFPSLESTFTIELSIKAKKEFDLINAVNMYFNENGIIINSFKIKKNTTDTEMKVNIRVFKNTSLDNILKYFSSIEDIIEISTSA